MMVYICVYGISIVTFPNELESTNDILYISDLNLLVMSETNFI